MIYKRGIISAFLCTAVSLLLMSAVVPANADYISLTNRYITAKLGTSGTIDSGDTSNSKQDVVAGRWAAVTVEGDPETSVDDNHELVFNGLNTPSSNFGCWKVKIGNDVRMIGDTVVGGWSKAPVAYPIPRSGQGLGRSGGYMEGEWKITTGATILVKIRMSLVRDQVRYELTLTNAGTASQNIGLEMFGDVDVDNMDSSGFTFIPGIGKVESASAVEPIYGTLLSGSNIPSILETYDSLSTPGMVARNTLGEQDCTPPDMLAVGDYYDLSGLNVWLVPAKNPADPNSYIPDPNKEVKDLSWLLCWNQKLLRPGATRKIVTYYGVGAASSMWTYKSGTKLQSDSAVLAVQGPRSLQYDSTVPATNDPVYTDDVTPQPFNIKAYVDNLATDSGPYELKNVSLFLYLPAGLELATANGNTARQNIGTVKINSEGSPAVWQVKATGNYSGELTYYVIARAASGWQQIVARKIMVPAAKKNMFKSGWQLVSVPYTFNNAAIDHVYGLSLGAFRSLYYDPNQANYVPVDQVEPGKAYWMLVYNMSYGQSQSCMLASDAALVGGQYGSQTDEYSVQLQEGWNMIGNPFVYPIYWGQTLVYDDVANTTVTLDQAVAKNLLSKTLFGWNPDQRTYENVKDNQSLILPWRGYWVYAKTPITLIFRPADFPGTSVTANLGGY